MKYGYYVILNGGICISYTANEAEGEVDDAEYGKDHDACLENWFDDISSHITGLVDNSTSFYCDNW